MNEQELAAPKEPQWIWGLRNIGQVVGLNYEQTKYLVKVGALTPQKVRRRHVMTDAEVRRQLFGAGE